MTMTSSCIAAMHHPDVSGPSKLKDTLPIPVQGRHHLTISEGIKDASIMHDAETQRFQWYQSVLEYEGSLDASFILTRLVPDLETASSTLDRALILEMTSAGTILEGSEPDPFSDTYSSPSLGSTSSPFPSPREVFTPTSLPDVFEDEDEQDRIPKIQDTNASYWCTSEIAIEDTDGSLLFGSVVEDTSVVDFNNVCDLRDPEDHWRECAERGAATRDFSSSWFWNPSSEYAHLLPSIIVSAPTDYDHTAEASVKTPLQDSLFGHRLTVPFSGCAYNTLPCDAPCGLSLESYIVNYTYIEVSSIEEQNRNGEFAVISTPLGCQRYSESELDEYLDEEDVCSRDVLTGCEMASSPVVMPACDGTNPFWLEDDEDDLPDLSGW